MICEKKIEGLDFDLTIFVEEEEDIITDAIGRGKSSENFYQADVPNLEVKIVKHFDITTHKNECLSIAQFIGEKLDDC